MDNKTILVIDDDKLLRTNMKHILEKAGYKILTSGSGECGITTALREKPDLILTDYLMYAASGLDVIKEIRLKTDIPIVMITCIGDLSVTIQAIRNGAYDYLLKPVTPEDLRNVVERALEI